jgi:hypothetical protein
MARASLEEMRLGGNENKCCYAKDYDPHGSRTPTRWESEAILIDYDEPHLAALAPLQRLALCDSIPH